MDGGRGLDGAAQGGVGPILSRNIPHNMERYRTWDEKRPRLANTMTADKVYELMEKVVVPPTQYYDSVLVIGEMRQRPFDSVNSIRYRTSPGLHKTHRKYYRRGYYLCILGSYRTQI